MLAVGSPEGLDNTMTIGIISAVGRQPTPDFPMLYIQTDAAINPGNSGGPLLDVEGELIGINTFMLSETGRNQGLGFAVPAAVVRYVYEQLRTRGVVRQSLVGVLVQTVTPGLAQGLDLSRGYGVMISDVLPGSPAEDAGLRPRDIISCRRRRFNFRITLLQRDDVSARSGCSAGGNGVARAADASVPGPGGGLR